MENKEKKEIDKKIVKIGFASTEIVAAGKADHPGSHFLYDNHLIFIFGFAVLAAVYFVFLVGENKNLF